MKKKQVWGQHHGIGVKLPLAVPVSHMDTSSNPGCSTPNQQPAKELGKAVEDSPTPQTCTLMVDPETRGSTFQTSLAPATSAIYGVNQWKDVSLRKKKKSLRWELEMQI